MISPIHVIKLGGSLLDLTDLPQRLFSLPELLQPGSLWIIGGGSGADLVRQMDAEHHFPAEKSHWMAIGAMDFNARVMQSVFPNSQLVSDFSQLQIAQQKKQIAIVEPLVWLGREAAAGIHTPHDWNFTSDSIAAHIAQQVKAEKLTLLKSTLPSEESDVDACVKQGLIDTHFPAFSREIPHIEFLNVRSQPVVRFVLR